MRHTGSAHAAHLSGLTESGREKNVKIRTVRNSDSDCDRSSWWSKHYSQFKSTLQLCVVIHEYHVCFYHTEVLQRKAAHMVWTERLPGGEVSICTSCIVYVLFFHMVYVPQNFHKTDIQTV